MIKKIMLTLIATMISASAALACNLNLTKSPVGMFSKTTPSTNYNDQQQKDTSAVVYRSN